MATHWRIQGHDTQFDAGQELNWLKNRITSWVSFLRVNEKGREREEMIAGCSEWAPNVVIRIILNTRMYWMLQTFHQDWKEVLLVNALTLPVDYKSRAGISKLPTLSSRKDGGEGSVTLSKPLRRLYEGSDKVKIFNGTQENWNEHDIEDAGR